MNNKIKEMKEGSLEYSGQVGLRGQMTFEQRTARSEGSWPAGWWGRASQARGTANARTPEGGPCLAFGQTVGQLGCWSPVSTAKG